MGIFDSHRVMETGTTPTIFAHGTRRIELLPGDIVSLWQCVDEPVASDGFPAYTRAVIKFHIPLRCFMWNKVATAVWAFEQGLTDIKPAFPIIAATPQEKQRILM